MYSDLTIECVLNNDVETIAAHLSIVWARSGTAMRAHIHAAYNLKVPTLLALLVQKYKY
jgi:hypothetical protein